MKKIAYLNSDNCSTLFNSLSDDIELTDKLKQEMIIKHPEVEFYSLTEFALAFNGEYITDLGLIAIVDENNNLIFGS